MTYETDCTCGKVVEVHAADAGGKVQCACGRAVEVPPLSKLRRLDPPPPRPATPPVDLAYLRVPGFITALTGVLFGCGAGLVSGAIGSEADGFRALAAMSAWAAQVVGVALVCVSKRFPVFVCVLLPPFGCLGLVAAMLIPERLPPVPPPPR